MTTNIVRVTRIQTFKESVGSIPHGIRLKIKEYLKNEKDTNYYRKKQQSTNFFF